MVDDDIMIMKTQVISWTWVGEVWEKFSILNTPRCILVSLNSPVDKTIHKENVVIFFFHKNNNIKIFVHKNKNIIHKSEYIRIFYPKKNLLS